MDLLVIGLLIFCTASSTLWVGHCQSTFDLLHYGAKGNGQTDDSEAFLKAWDAACGATGKTTPTLLVPAGHSFILQPVNFKGPCKSKNMHVQILGTIQAPQKSAWKNCIKNSWIVFSDVECLSLDGSGVIDGQGSGWWTSKSTPINASGICNSRRPTALRFQSCHGLKVSGLKHINGPGGHINVFESNGVTLSNLNITAPRDSPNTDGIDISRSTQVTVSNSFIGVGDDCIAIKGGCSHLKITQVVCGPGHGISIGSLGQDGGHDEVEDVHVWNCSIDGATNGARIKTCPGGTGYTRNISFEHITFRNTKYPIIIDQHYANKGQKPLQVGGIKVSNVTYYNFTGTSATDRAISLDCGSMGCSNVSMNQINLTSADPGRKATAFCTNVQGTSNNTTPNVNCLSK